MWHVSHGNVLHSVAKVSTGLLRPPFKYLPGFSACRSSTVATHSTFSQSRHNSLQQNKGTCIMSAGDWGYQWGYPPPLPYESFNPEASGYVPVYSQGQIPPQPQPQPQLQPHPHPQPQFQPQAFTPFTPFTPIADIPMNTPIPPPETDSPPYSPPPFIGSEASRSQSPAIINGNGAKPGKHPKSKKSKKGRDEKVQPSAASGGVPDPSPEYLTLAAYPPFRLPYARKILVVIDLNGTLLYRPSRHNPTAFIERPHARTFLRYCIDTFKVVIWSSAKPYNVTRMCEQLLTPEQRSRVVAVWGRDHFGLTQEDYYLRVLCYKRLSALWADPEVAASHPEFAEGKRWSQADTVLVDDSVEKARTEPYNIIQIPEFKGDATEEGFVLPQVHDYVNECAHQTDISTYIRNQPFKTVPGWKLLPPNSVE